MAFDLVMAPIDVQAAFVAGAARATATGAKVGDISCAACGETFATQEEYRLHCKSERHVYNVKRRQNGLKPISQEVWERKLKESRSGYQQKGTAHLKAGKPVRQAPSNDAKQASTPTEASVEAAEAEEAPLTPRSCLFDRKHFDSIELNLAYMEKTYGFYVHDPEYCNDFPGLLSYLHMKIAEGVCIHCNRRFPDRASCLKHMIDKNHCRLATEVFTRRGKYDEAATEDMQEELEPFYDYHSSVREVAEKIMDKKQKVASILRFFDEDKDQRLSRAEVAELWAAANDGAELSQAQYAGACSMASADPDEGIDVKGLEKLYTDGFADLDAHFKMLQDLLVQKHKRPMQTVEEGDEDAEDDDDEGEESEEEDEEVDEVLECDDEDEFEEVLRVLGLQKVQIDDNGDLRLPNGATACHRDVSYIYKQRGVRQTDIVLSGPRKTARAQLMLTNSSSGCQGMAISRRQEARQGKQILAILRSKQHYEMRLGMTQGNLLQKRNATKIRTGRGDCSNGR